MPRDSQGRFRIGWGRADDGKTGRNDRISLVGRTRRIPVEGFASIKQHFQGGRAGRAIILVPPKVRFEKPVTVLVHLHGFNNGYRDRGDGPRDVEWDRLPQQLEASGKRVIAVLPQGTGRSGFDANRGQTQSAGFDVDALVDEVREALVSLRVSGPMVQIQGIIISGHSGGGNPIVSDLSAGHGLSPSRYRLLGVILLDGINGSRRMQQFSGWMRARIASQASALRRIRGDRRERAYMNRQPAVYLAFAARGSYARRYGAVDFILQRNLEELTGGRLLRGTSRNLLRSRYRVDPVPGQSHGTIVGDGVRGRDGTAPYRPGAGTVDRALNFILL